MNTITGIFAAALLLTATSAHAAQIVLIDPTTGDVSLGSIEHETRLTLQGLEQILALSGSSLNKVVKAHVFLADIDRDFDGMNRVYAEFFDPPYPARRTVQAKLARGLKVEIDVIALP